MATSPREELRILTITQFEKSSSNGQWYWHTDAPNGETLGDSGEGYFNLSDAIDGFFAQQGYNPRIVDTDPAAAHFSKLLKVGDEYHIRRYAYGAPDPYDPDQPMALAEQGYVPPGVEYEE